MDVLDVVEKEDRTTADSGSETNISVDADGKEIGAQKSEPVSGQVSSKKAIDSEIVVPEEIVENDVGAKEKAVIRNASVSTSDLKPVQGDFVTTQSSSTIVKKKTVAKRKDHSKGVDKEAVSAKKVKQTRSRSLVQTEPEELLQEIHVDNRRLNWVGRGVKMGLRVLKPTVFNGLTLPEVKRFYSRLGGAPLSTASGVAILPANHHQLPVPGKIFKPKKSQNNTSILYFHGGAYQIGSTSVWQKFASHLAKAINTTLYMPDYRLAPKNPYPAALDDCFDSYRMLVENNDPDKLFVAGDSAGGGLAISVLARARQKGLPMPKKLVLFSPWTDLAAQGDSYRTHRRRDPILSTSWLSSAVKQYTGTGFWGRINSDLVEAISPLNEAIEGFPETIIQVGSEEILLSDSQRLAEKLAQSGTSTRLEIWDGLWHAWQLCTFLPESRKALDHLASFVGYQENR